MFNRWIEPLIRADLEKGRTVLLVGSRRVGKTTLARMIDPEKSIYHTFDDVDLQTVVRKSPKYLERICEKGLLNILDEIQKVPEMFDTIKLMIDSGYQFILTGSSALHLLEKISETLAGRIRIRHLSTCAWGEAENELAAFADSSIISNQTMEERDPLLLQQAKTDFSTFIQYGGFPELAGKSLQDKEEILRDYRNTYLQRDILELTNVQDVSAFRALVAALAQSIGSTVNYQHLARESGLSHITAKKYLHALEQTFIVFKVLPYHYGPSKRYLKSAKWYFADVGLLNALNVRLSEGQLFENFVIGEVHKRLMINNWDQERMFFYRSEKGAEIDLLVEHKNDLLLYEIKSARSIGPKFTRNIKRFQPAIANEVINVRKHLIYQGETFKLDEDIRCIPVYSWYGFA